MCPRPAPHSGATATKNFASKRALLLAVQLTGRPACAREAAACDGTVEGGPSRAQLEALGVRAVKNGVDSLPSASDFPALLRAVGASELAPADRRVFSCPLLRCGNEGIRF